MFTDLPPLAVVIPAAGVGKRMKSNVAKQYLKVQQDYVLDHTLKTFINLPFVHKVYLVVSVDDPYFATLKHAGDAKIIRVTGGRERADSVLNGINTASVEDTDWVMVHDAARPCLTQLDIIQLYQACLAQNQAGILATPVRDTMKRAFVDEPEIKNTVDRKNLWHALTPQCAPLNQLKIALQDQINDRGQVNKLVTDEASALEMAGHSVLLVEGKASNIKITHPEDLQLAEFYIQHQLTSEKNNHD